MTIQQRNQKKEEFISWLLESNLKFFSYPVMRSVLGRWEEFKEDLINTNKITKITPELRIKNEFRGKVIYSVLASKYKYNGEKTVNIEENPYYIKLNSDKVRKRISGKDLAILDHINKTLSRTTVNGELITNNYLTISKSRIYSDFVQFKKETRKDIKIDNQKTISFDLRSSVIQLFSQTNLGGMGYDHKLFFDFKNNPDFWLFISKKMNKTRDEVKDLFMTALFGNYVPKEIFSLYPVFFFNLSVLKKKFGYLEASNLYFKLEKNVMGELMETLMLNRIDFLPVHDCLIVKESDYGFVREVFESNNLKYSLEY